MKEWNQYYLLLETISQERINCDFYNAKIKKQRKIPKGELGDYMTIIRTLPTFNSNKFSLASLKR